MSGLFRASGGAPFADRSDAGRQIARRLPGYSRDALVVFALPRGGVPVAFEVAVSLGAPLGVVLARKLGAPNQPELGIGAVAQGGKRVLNASLIRQLGVSGAYIERATLRETQEIEARERLFGATERPNLRGRTAILVDDGLATGVTAQAAILAVRELEPRRVVLASPVCAPQTAASLRPEVDDLLCLESPRELGAIGYWYRDFEQVTDAEVVELLETARSQGI